jgi:hypothetical protein
LPTEQVTAFASVPGQTVPHRYRTATVSRHRLTLAISRYGSVREQSVMAVSAVTVAKLVQSISPDRKEWPKRTLMDPIRSLLLLAILFHVRRRCDVASLAVSVGLNLRTMKL